MSVAILHSRAISGMDAAPVTVEAHLANGLPSFTIVGLPETEVKEAKDRVRAALQTARFDLHHDQPGAGRSAEREWTVRPRDCTGHPGRVRTDPRRRVGTIRVRR